MEIINRTGSDRVFIDRENDVEIPLPMNQVVEVNNTIGETLLKIGGFEIVKRKRRVTK